MSGYKYYDDDYEPDNQSQSTNITEKQSNVIPTIDYCFSEDKLILELKEYIDKTYGQHYAKSKIQSTEFIMDAGHGEGFCIGNIIKYAQRYGKKAGKNRADLLKVCHYSIMMLHVHDQEMKDKNESISPT